MTEVAEDMNQIISYDLGARTLGDRSNLSETARRKILRLPDGRHKRREFPIDPEKLREKLKPMLHPAEDYGLRHGALVVTADGPNKVGKSTSIQLVGAILHDRAKLTPVFVKESKYADVEVEAARKKYFLTNGAFGGNPFERLELINRVRISALDNPRFQQALKDPQKVLFLNRSYLTTLAYQLYHSLKHDFRKDHSEAGRTLKRNRARYLCQALAMMEDTFFQEDVALIYNCDPSTASHRMAGGAKEMSGEFPPEELHDAYDLIASMLMNSPDERYPLGRQYNNRSHITGWNNVYRVDTTVPKGVPPQRFYEATNKDIADIILQRFDDTLEERIRRVNGK